MEFKDIVALAVVVLTFIALFLDKISAETAVTIIAAILSFYMGVKIGVELGKKKRG